MRKSKNTSILVDLCSNEIETLESKFQIIEKKLANAPEGSVQIKHFRKRVALYRHYKNDAGENVIKYISIKSPLAVGLVQKRYYIKLKNAVSAELKALRLFTEHYHPAEKYSAYASLPVEIQGYIEPLFKDIETRISEWAQESYDGNSYKMPESAIHDDKHGGEYRSKAEYIISGILGELELINKYELAYTYGNKTYYPDFTIIHPKTGELYYLEYFGMMDRPDYMYSALKKIAFYQSTPDANRFVYIFESSETPINPAAIKNYLKSIFRK